jgi:hypothetical protein
MAARTTDDALPASERITKTIEELGDWRGAVLSTIRELVLAAAPGVTEEVKWVKPSNPAGVPTWSKDGILCTGEIYKEKVKLTFMHGASVVDPSNLFNSSLDAGTRRAIDLHEGDTLDPDAFEALVRAAVEVNADRAGSKKRPAGR